MHTRAPLNAQKRHKRRPNPVQPRTRTHAHRHAHIPRASEIESESLVRVCADKSYLSASDIQLNKRRTQYGCARACVHVCRAVVPLGGGCILDLVECTPTERPTDRPTYVYVGGSVCIIASACVFGI